MLSFFNVFNRYLCFVSLLLLLSIIISLKFMSKSYSVSSFFDVYLISCFVYQDVMNLFIKEEKILLSSQLICMYVCVGVGVGAFRVC